MQGTGADIIVLNPNASFNVVANSHHSRTDTNVYEGRTGKGRVEVTILRRRIVWKDVILNITPSLGRYVEMPPFGYLFDGIKKADAEYLASMNAPVRHAIATS